MFDLPNIAFNPIFTCFGSARQNVAEKMNLIALMHLYLITVVSIYLATFYPMDTRINAKVQLLVWFQICESILRNLMKMLYYSNDLVMMGGVRKQRVSQVNQAKDLGDL